MQVASSPTPSEVTVLAEVLALGAVVLNAHYATANGEVLTAEKMADLIARADQTSKRGHASASRRLRHKRPYESRTRPAI